MKPNKPQLTEYQRDALAQDAINIAKGSNKLDKQYLKEVKGYAPERHKEQAPKIKRDMKDTSREAGTAAHYHWNTPVSELQAMADEGHPTEVSGDALSRAREGTRPKTSIGWDEDETFTAKKS